MNEYYGISTYHVVADPNGEYIDHIDCWGKFLSPNRVLIREVPSSHPQYNMIEDVVDYFQSVPTSDGGLWEIFRVYTPSDQPYTNSLILNDKVFVPIMNSSWDDEALEVYEIAMPNHEILGFTGSWQSTDALHCRVKGVPDISYSPFQNGDINMDSSIDILDVVVLVNFVLGSDIPDNMQTILSDLNDDGIINILDIISLINIILGVE
tara:strand:- start:762 stop:1385 length:624 start_codon:yes stop_codon:yes gene_type:complete